MSRVPWEDLPTSVRSWAECSLGSSVAEAASQPGGFSPGAACRLRLADGRRAFLKAVCATANPQSPGMHRREGAVAAALPPDVPAPALLGQYDDGEWVALLFTDVDGVPPAEPWQTPQLIQVLSALAELHRACTPSPSQAVPSVADYLAEDLRGWRELAALGHAGSYLEGHPGSRLEGHPGSRQAGQPGSRQAGQPGSRQGGHTDRHPDQLARLDGWSARYLDRLAELESRWPDAAAGTTLLHSDVRADNMLITEDGVVFVDWPHACTGAPWFDVVAFAPSVAMQGGPDPEWVLGHASSADGADPDAVTAVVAAVAGYFTRQALLPDPPGLPTVRAFQAAQGEPARAWLRRRTGWP
jgi:aminoglycoside phosphotransferase (APT) family kinase protein